MMSTTYYSRVFLVGKIVLHQLVNISLALSFSTLGGSGRRGGRFSAQGMG